MSIFSGLEKFGLGNLKDEKVFDDKAVKETVTKKEAVKVAPTPFDERDVLFEKSCTCPVCDNKFNTLTVRAGKVHVKAVETDLRPVYEQVDMIKYDVVACPKCGYAALARYFDSILKRQKEEVAAKISSNFKPIDKKYEIYTYDDALDRYQLALANAIVKNAKASEKAYLCLRYAWLIRGILQDENMMAKPEYTPEKKAQLKEEEKELLKNAQDGFVQAKQSEDFPIAGMNEITLDYLIAALYVENEEYDKAGKIISSILTSRSATSRIKDKARDLKDLIQEKKGVDEEDD
ncbi:DUF2225 domain-containing protein [Butyrivibrio sp. NC3005]|uniref:DUF2225 domain-containing protein n=1 Tax=Butyrivibrio sp. NC3005 TaxID=1280685 RepID=UPI0003FE34CA|nr:DUF2225 domain-containing protein [Butyrivibrio sp. NC3005]